MNYSRGQPQKNKIYKEVEMKKNKNDGWKVVVINPPSEDNKNKLIEMFKKELEESIRKEV